MHLKLKSFCSTEIRFANKKKLIEIIKSFHTNNMLLVMSKTSALRWNMLTFIDELQYKCNSVNRNFIWINNITSNPTQIDIINSLQLIGSKKIDIVIAIGGGSTIDLAKSICAFYNYTKNNIYTLKGINDSLKNGTYKGRKYPKIIAVPTTAGTGSEVTEWATVWDKERISKFSLDDIMLKPILSIIVPELTLSMSTELTLFTGLDAMSHAIEAYWSKNTSPIVQEISIRAIEIIRDNLRKAIEHPNILTIRENLCNGSLLAGLAFSQTKTTACHSISYPLTMLHNVPHGIATAITLDSIAKINKGHFPNDASLFSLFDLYGGIKEWIEMVCKNIVIMKLSSFDIKKEDIQAIVDNAFTENRMHNNQVYIDRNIVSQILHDIL